MSEPCSHDAITVYAELDGPGRMWACANCGRRFYPACATCVDVGHRGEEHPDLVPLDRAAWIEVPPGERLISESDPEMVRLREIERAASWLVGIWSGNVAIEAGSALWEDIGRLHAALAAEPEP